MLRMVLFWSLFLALNGCTTVDVREEYADLPESEALEARYYDVDIPMRDGVILRATVYQPKLAPGETAPLIVQTHGFGTFRTSGPISIYGKFVITGKAALDAWRNGYWVVSYDQRGFGDSGGNVEMMDPAFEPRDAMEVITWSNRHLPRLARETPDDPLVGMLGESWGGGVQLLASVFDPRIDAIVPITAWHDLAESLAPNGQVRTYWGAVLASAGTFASGFDFGKMFQPAYLDMFSGEMTDRGRAELAKASPSSYCAAKRYPQADMLLIQGFNDTVFPVNEALKNQQCALEAGRDARVVAIQGGHRLPWPTQSISGFPMYNAEDKVNCGDTRFETPRMITQWFDLKLKNKPEPTPIPSLCVTFPEEKPGVSPQRLLVGSERFDISPVSLRLVQTGWLEPVMQPLDHAVSWLVPDGKEKDAPEQGAKGGIIRPLFVPLWVARTQSVLAGIPEVDLNLQDSSDDNKDVVYAAVGVRRKGSVAIEVLGDQFLPLVGNGRYQQSLTAVAAVLEEDDTVGIVLQGFSGQFFFNPEGWFSKATLAGQVSLPLLNSDVPGGTLASK